jgi:hypothetical protein
MRVSNCPLYRFSGEINTKSEVPEEPGAKNPHAGIRGGAGRQLPVLRYRRNKFACFLDKKKCMAGENKNMPPSRAAI